MAAPGHAAGVCPRHWRAAPSGHVVALPGEGAAMGCWGVGCRGLLSPRGGRTRWPAGDRGRNLKGVPFGRASARAGQRRVPPECRDTLLYQGGVAARSGHAAAAAGARSVCGGVRAGEAGNVDGRHKVLGVSDVCRPCSAAGLRVRPGCRGVAPVPSPPPPPRGSRSLCRSHPPPVGRHGAPKARRGKPPAGTGLHSRPLHTHGTHGRCTWTARQHRWKKEKHPVIC